MESSDKKSELLRSFLGTLPVSTAQRLAKAIEIDRQAEGSALPHDIILEGLRPVLRRSVEPGRTLTPLRLFCRPFEDLLYSGPHPEKHKGRIMRTSVVPAWNWVQKLVPAQSGDYVGDVRNLVMAQKHDEALERARAFWPEAGGALRAAIDGKPAAARTALGGDIVVEDAREMALMLCAGSAMTMVQALMPRRTAAMTDELVWQLRAVYDGVVETTADAAPFVPVVAMRRLARPWEALKLALNVSRQSQDTLIASTDMGLVGDLLFADMEDCRATVMAARQPSFDLDSLLSNLAGFTNASSAIVKEVEILRRGKWGQRLLGDRAAVGSTMDGFMERAPKEIAAAMPTHRTGFAGGPRAADFSKPVDPERTERALRYARLLAGTRALAAPGSFGAKHKDAVDEVTQMLRGYTEDVLKEMRGAEGARREVVDQQFRLVAELTQLLVGEEEAELLRRRGKAAATPAAA